MNSSSFYRYCGRVFTCSEIDMIRQFIATEPKRNRLELSKIICEQFQWLRPNGRFKDMSCRVAMLRMHRDGLICLPAPQSKNGNGKTRPKISSASDPQKSISLPAGQLGHLLFRPISTQKDSYLWAQPILRIGMS